MAKFEPISFSPNLAHVLGFRHGPRAANPPAGNVWDYDTGLSQKAWGIARRTIDTYLPGIEPVGMSCSQIEARSRPTLIFLWPHLAARIQMDRRLGIERHDVPKWAPCDAHPNPYSMTPQEMHALQPDLVDECGRNFLNAAYDLAVNVGLGKIGAMCSHVPFADAGARRARLKLGIKESDGWLPGKGFETGAFVHLAFGERTPHWTDEIPFPPGSKFLFSCEYYPVPAE
ncbi:MAG: hypothetical protein AAB480_01585 [Patescibacteria group bacterium]